MGDSSQQVVVVCNENFREILMAEFAAINYDSIQETEEGFLAHSSAMVSIDDLEDVISRYQHQAGARYHIEEIAIQNWNQEWENSFEPIIVEDQVIVRASFHKSTKHYPVEIIINPKMSFGTGHHETTYLMMKKQLQIDHEHKAVLDAGCGTGILSILAGKLGASTIDAFDNDKWVEDNIQENFKINSTKAGIQIGTMDSLIFNKEYDLVLANINKNVLLHDLPSFSRQLKKSGRLVMSGFYIEDLPDIKSRAEQYGLKFAESEVKNKWVVAIFNKI